MSIAKSDDRSERTPAWVERAMLPPRYQNNAPISNAPMGGAAELVFDDLGLVAWDSIWADFCDLALAGGPPHRETMLEFGTSEGRNPAVRELCRAARMLTEWDAWISAEPGRFEIECPDEDTAQWLQLAITAENVRAEAFGTILVLPADASFQLTAEIKNIATALAKAHHYWTEHRDWLESLQSHAN